MSGTFILNSISQRLHDDIITNISDFFSGLKTFIEIIKFKVNVDVLKVKKLENKLQSLSLTKQPAENVQKFNKKVILIATKLENCNATSDLNTLVAKLYIKSFVRLFCSETWTIFNECNKNPKTRKWLWKKILKKLLNTYDSLKTQNVWDLLKKQNSNNQINVLT